MPMTQRKCPIVVLISGSGSNLQAIIDAQQQPEYPAQISAVISNIAGVKGLERAAKADIPTHVISHQGFSDRESYDREISSVIDQYNPCLVILAGFMRILSDWFVDRYAGKLLNIHPSLLPKYKGLNTHQKVLDAGDSMHGATVHFVTPELDGGPLILQAAVPVMAHDSATSLAARVLEKEHLIYPLAINWVASGRVSMNNGKLMMDDEKLQHPVLLDDI